MDGASPSLAPHRGCTVTVTVMSVLSTGLGADQLESPPASLWWSFKGTAVDTN